MKINELCLMGTNGIGHLKKLEKQKKKVKTKGFSGSSCTSVGKIQ